MLYNRHCHITILIAGCPVKRLEHHYWGKCTGHFENEGFVMHIKTPNLKGSAHFFSYNFLGHPSRISGCVKFISSCKCMICKLFSFFVLDAANFVEATLGSILTIA